MAGRKSSQAEFLNLLVNRYLKHLLRVDYSPRTVSLRRRHLGEFTDWCSDRDVHFAVELTTEVTRSYHYHLSKRRGPSGGPLSYSSQLLSLRAFLRWLTKEKLLQRDAALELELPQEDLAAVVRRHRAVRRRRQRSLSRRGFPHRCRFGFRRTCPRGRMQSVLRIRLRPTTEA